MSQISKGIPSLVIDVGPQKKKSPYTFATTLLIENCRAIDCHPSSNPRQFFPYFDIKVFGHLNRFCRDPSPVEAKILRFHGAQPPRPEGEVDCGGPSDMTPSPSTNMTIGLKIGDLAPDFKATAVGGIYGGGQEVKFADFAGSTLVLYFYPKDGTPGCTAQACDLRDSWRELQSKVELFGISGDSVESHQKFIKKHGLPFPLLSDPNHEIIQAYQVGFEKSGHGRKYMGTERTTYLIGPDRRIKAILKKVKPAEHVTQLLKALAS